MVGEIEVIFGGVSSLACRGFTSTERINASSTATISFDKSDFLQLGAINYLDEVVINSVSQKRLLYRGNIVSIKCEPNNQILIMLDNGVELAETGIKSLKVLNIYNLELAYSFARLADFPKDQIVIPGLDNSVKEMVAYVPFKGFLIEENEIVGKVQFLNRKSIEEKLPKTEESEAWNRFLDADGWITFRFKSAHFADAESVAVEKADVFLSAYSALLQYSYSQFGGDFIEWERINMAVSLKRQNHILLVMLPTGSTWLRDLSPYKRTQTTLKSTNKLDIGLVMDATESFQLPLLVWNRFRDSEDYYLVAIGLSQVVELLSTGVKLPKSYTQAQLSDITSRAVVNLTEKESPLVRAAIKRLNDGALMIRFNQRLTNIGITLSEHEQELINKFRGIRNAIDHGRKAEEPSIQEIKQVKALVNRVILASLTASKSKQ